MDIKFKVWTGEKMLGPYDLSQHPSYWVGLEDGDRLLITTIKDKNGKNVYDGDIIRDDTSRNKKVFFKNGAFGCEESKRKSFYSDEIVKVFYPLSDYYQNEIEIIGNIYENKDLLNEL